MLKIEGIQKLLLENKAEMELVYILWEHWPVGRLNHHLVWDPLEHNEIASMGLAYVSHTNTQTGPYGSNLNVNSERSRQQTVFVFLPHQTNWKGLAMKDLVRKKDVQSIKRMTHVGRVLLPSSPDSQSYSM